ncbi:hypothetical protein CWRG_02861 [Chthonomonas calidirosea]|uniref:hypothetical protein n=1 Tax=Chthonomonas calidirosea TaxID=454171 RepID=UPI0006DD4914|nr:hypothetical protein [Chthonomonas calidirosea]CEK20521.1 hypothetical protein CWRG_02861 [Chthonomonas calidirosea]
MNVSKIHCREPKNTQRAEPTEATLAELLQRLQHHEKRARRHMRLMVSLSVLSAILMFLVEMVWVVLALQGGIETLPLWAVHSSWLLFLAMLAGVVIVYTKDMHAGRKLLQNISTYRDVRVVGPLLSLWSISSPRTRGAIEEALIELLPQMKAADAALLNEEQRAQLYAILTDTNRRRVPLQLAILEVLGRIGDAHAVPIVERLSEAPLRRWKVLREAAQRCLPQLRERVLQLQQSSTLLRPSANRTKEKDVLLRTADSAPLQTPAEQLVRPTDAKETTNENSFEL